MAGDNLESAPKLYPATLNAFDTTLISIGDLSNWSTSESVQEITRSNEISGNFLSLIFKENRLIGATLIGDMSKVASVISGVQNRFSYQDALDKKIIK